MDVRKNTSRGNGDTTKKLVELLIVADGKLNVARDDTGALVIAGGVSGKLEDLSGEVLKNSSEVDGGTTSNTSGV
eukprot:704021-Amorphochlora_amoeboformis.AAC.1